MPASERGHPADQNALALLADLVAAYDELERPVQATRVAAAGDADPETVRTRLTRLATCELVVAESGGFRPTVTARELLALDLDDDFVIVDCREPES